MRMHGERMRAGEETHNWMKGAAYLALAAIFAKVLSALYKIPYQNITGDIGFYVYQQVYPLYGVILVLGTYGFPLVIATLMNDGQTKSASVVNSRLLLLFTAMCGIFGVSGLLVLLFSDSIAHLMGDPALSPSIEMLAYPFFLIPFLAIFRGFFQGIEEEGPVAVSQVTEQVARVVVILFVAYLAMTRGNPYQAGLSAGAGALAGGIFAILVFLIFLLRKKRWRAQSFSFSFYPFWKKDVLNLMISGFFVSISAMALINIQLVDAFTIFNILAAEFSNIEAAVQKGIYDRGWPLVQFGAIITTVFSYALLPSLARANQRKEIDRVRMQIEDALKICFVFGGAASIGLIAVMPWVNQAMFSDRAGTDVLQVMSLIVLFGALFMTKAALLHALGRARAAALFFGAGLLLKISLNLILVPIFGLMGAAWSGVVSFALMSVLSGAYLLQKKLWRTPSIAFISKWLLALFVMWLFVYGNGTLSWDNSNQTRAAAFAISISGASLGFVFYIFLIWRLRLFTKRQWEDLPKIGKWLPYLKKRS